MKADVSDKLRSYLLGARAKSLSALLALIRSDLKKLLSEYMELSGEMSIVADIDESGREILFHLDFSADEVYDVGDMLVTRSEFA